jgi:hypothetical protein
MYPLNDAVVAGLPARGVPYGSERDRLAGYGVVSFSDGRLTRLPAPRQGWSVGGLGPVLEVAGNHVVWLETQRQAGGYGWALYSAPADAKARPRVLAHSRTPVPVSGVPAAIGSDGRTVCWASSASDRRWTVTRRPITGSDRQVTGSVTDMVGSCQPDGRDTLVATRQGPHDPPMGAGDSLPGNVFDLGTGGTVRTLLKGAYNVAARGNQIAFYSYNNPDAESWTLHVARLTSHGLTAVRKVGPRGVSQFAWLDSQHLIVVTGPAPGDSRPMLLVNVRTGRSTIIAAPPSGIAWMTVSGGQLLYEWDRPPAGPGQTLEIDDFTLPHQP